MKKFKTLIHRVGYADKFDADLEKTMGEIREEGGKIVDVHLAMSDMQIAAVIEYEEKRGGSKASTAKA